MLHKLPIVLAVMVVFGCATDGPRQVAVREVDPGRNGPQPLAMKQFVHIANDGNLLVVGGPLGKSRSLTAKALFAEVERLGPKGLVLLYSLEADARPSVAARMTVKRIDALDFPKKQVDPPPGTSSPYGGGATILMAKAQAGDLEWVEDLLVRRVDVQAVDDDGKTALIYAAGAGRTLVVDRLIAQGARVDNADRDGSTALMFAAQSGHGQVTKSLIKAGARASVRGAHGMTALDFAARAGHRSVVATLRSAR